MESVTIRWLFVIEEMVKTLPSEGYDKWFAGYQTASPYYPYKYAMWQYTSTGSINGVSGNIDINIAMKKLKK